MHSQNKIESKAKNIILWLLQCLVAVAFLGTGFAKLSGQPMMVETFAHIGIGQWFRYLTGSIEIASAILLLIPKAIPAGALFLVGTMSGAVLTHFFLIGGNPLPAAVLLVLSATVLWGRKNRLMALL